jgi:hypothetical protein
MYQQTASVIDKCFYEYTEISLEGQQVALNVRRLLFEGATGPTNKTHHTYNVRRHLGTLDQVTPKNTELRRGDATTTISTTTTTTTTTTTEQTP